MRHERFQQRLIATFILFRSKAIKHQRSSELGLTLMENLVAIVMITIFISLLTPPILLAVATRIQNRRAEQAMLIAQQEIDRVRRIVETGSYVDSCSTVASYTVNSIDCLPPADSSITALSSIANAAAPNSICSFTCTSAPNSRRAVLTSSGEFFVQSFREPGQALNGQVVAFRVGVRVYHRVAEGNLGSLNTDPASIQLTQGLGEQTYSPLAVLFTDFVRGDLTGSLDRYRSFLR